MVFTYLHLSFYLSICLSVSLPLSIYLCGTNPYLLFLSKTMMGYITEKREKGEKKIKISTLLSWQWGKRPGEYFPLELVSWLTREAVSITYGFSENNLKVVEHKWYSVSNVFRYILLLVSPKVPLYKHLLSRKLILISIWMVIQYITIFKMEH
jgi:hypothetical protein